MKDTELIDYAHPMMMAENALRDAYNALLHGDSDKGIEHLLNAMVEVKMALNAVRYAKGNQR